MKSEKLRVCVIGCGDMGAKHAAAWARRDDARVVAVSSPTEARRRALADKFGAKAYADAYEAMDQDDVNVVSICTPAGFHADYACHAMRRGRHVLCEKPIALTLADAGRMIACAAEHRVHLATSFQYRGLPRIAKYRELFLSGELGSPLLMQYRDTREVRPKLAMHRPEGNGGVVIDMAGHHIDAFRYITGAEPVEVTATGHTFGRGKPRLQSIERLAIDAATLQIRFAGGHALQLLLNWGMPEGFPEQRAEYLAGPKLAGVVETAEFDKQFCLQRGIEREVLPDAVPNHASRVDDLAEAILNGKPLEVTGQDGRVALRVSLAALQSIQTERSVPL